MASIQKCRFCGAAVRSDERKCPQCGAPNELFVADMVRTIFLPKTIEELKEYCAERGMPLLRMRFFIGEDYRKPRAFGIYQKDDRFIVYKNKANGERSIRYSGPDEEYAVGELFAKLLEECHNRGIYPDGKTDAVSRSSGSKQKKKNPVIIPLIVIIACIMVTAVMMLITRQNHQNDGYYHFPNQGIYYRYGSSWYYSTPDSDWVKTETIPVDNTEAYYKGDTFQSGWGKTSFKESDEWRRIQESHSSSSSDYESWDSNDTDWNSDW